MTQQDLKALNQAAARAAAALILCGAIIGAASAEDDSRAAVLERIKPIGTVVVSGAVQPAAPAAAAPAEGAPAESAPAPAATAESAPAEPAAAEPAQAAPAAAAPAETAAAVAPAADAIDGKAVFMKICFACHIPGVAGAPKLGDKAAWAPRIAQGKATLLTHALHGFQGKAGVMPPKGGATYLSDDEVSAAIDYMVSQGE